jgi:hypothetical protein
MRNFYRVHFKQIMACNTEIWTLTKRDRSKIQAVGITFFRYIGRTHEGIGLEVMFIGNKLQYRI